MKPDRKALLIAAARKNPDQWDRMLAGIKEDVRAAAVIQELAAGGLSNPILDGAIAGAIGRDADALTKEQRQAIAVLAIVLQPLAVAANADPVLAFASRAMVKVALRGLRKAARRQAPPTDGGAS